MTDALTASLEIPQGPALAKAPTGIAGLDEITFGGFPRGRTTVLAGGAGSGKSMLAIEFLVHGARDFGEPGVLLTFEESAEKVTANVASLGFDLQELQDKGQLLVQAFIIDPAEIVETGAFDLDGLFLFLADAVARVNAKRVVLDTIEVLFGAFQDAAIIRGELTRLFRWLEEHHLTSVVTGERGDRHLTRHGIEEYVSDCVILLDHRVEAEVSTRRLRIVKYRGSLHGTNEYPFLMTGGGVLVQPLSAVGLAYEASTRRISTGVPRLDHVLGGGIFEGSTVLISGNAGTGKTSLAAQLAVAACARGEHVLYVLYEESSEQLIRNMKSIGLDLSHWVDEGLLHFFAARPSAYGLENHLAGLTRLVDELKPSIAMLDALTSFSTVASPREVTGLVTRKIALLKSRGITSVITSLAEEAGSSNTEMGVASLVDTWLLLRNVEADGERNRLLFVLKSRGTRHSNQVREFVLTDHGPDLVDVYVGPDGVSVGSARLQRLAEEREKQQRERADTSTRQRQLQRRTDDLNAQIDALRESLVDADAEMRHLDDDAHQRGVEETEDVARMRSHRWADPAEPGEPTADRQ